MTDSRRLGAVVAATWLVVAGLLVPVGVTAAANDDVVVSGSVVYQTGSGLTVTDATAANLRSETPFSDGETVSLPGLNLSATGSGAVTVDRRNGTYTNLSAIDASQSQIEADPSDKPAVTLGPGLDSVAFRDPSYEVTGDDVDLEYAASGTATLSVQTSGLSEGDRVEMIDAGDGTVLDDATVDDSGVLSFTSLPAGTYVANLSKVDTQTPTAEAGPDRSVDEGTTVDFDATASTDNGDIVSYEWDWTDDGTSDATGATPSHRYDSEGTYTVRLRVTDANGNTATDTLSVTVEDDGGGGGSSSSGGGDPDTPTPAPTEASQTTTDSESTRTATESPDDDTEVSERNQTETTTPVSSQQATRTTPPTTTARGPLSPALVVVALLSYGLLMGRSRGGEP